MRIECSDGTWYTYTAMVSSSNAMFAVSPVVLTTSVRCGRDQAPSSRVALSPSRIILGPKEYCRDGSCRTYPRLTSVRTNR